jgi:nitrate/TMAO reductase-like tetraheme cytochrome c subunit
MTFAILVSMIGSGLVFLLFLGAYLVTRHPARHWKHLPPISLGVTTISAVAFYKITALVSFTVLPVATVSVATYRLFEGAKEVQSCASCHVMQPMVTDLSDPRSTTLAARHVQNGWISKAACYRCHSGYGFNGTLAAKLEGYRHLVRYTTGTFEEPIASRALFDQASCLHCHGETPAFLGVNSHRIGMPQFASNELSCLNCHGLAHPTRKERTPGSLRYAELMAPNDAAKPVDRHVGTTEDAPR